MAAVDAPELPPQMRAQFLDAFNQPYALRSVPLPALDSPHDLLIRVDAASYCHTDAVLAAGQMPPHPPSFPHVGCHEFAGTVVRVAGGDDDGSRPAYRVGDRVGVPGRSYHPCGSCFECRQTTSSPLEAAQAKEDADPPGYSVYCPHAQNHGINRPGGFQEFAVVDARQVAPLPAQMRAVDAAPLMCAGVTVYAALKRCGLRRGGGPGEAGQQQPQRVAIVGCGGGLGHLGLQFALRMGLRVVGVDNADGPLALARDVVRGIEGDAEEAAAAGKASTRARIVDARVEEAGDVAQQLGREDGKTERGEMGVDAAIVLPESQAAFDYGMALLRNHGRCVVVSFPEAGFHVSARDVVFRDIAVVGSLVGSNRVLREMLDFAAGHEVRARLRTFPLAKLNELVDEYGRGGGGKLVVDMSLPDD